MAFKGLLSVALSWTSPLKSCDILPSAISPHPHLWWSLMACGSQFPEQGLDTGPQQWKCRVLTAGPPRTPFLPLLYSTELEVDSWILPSSPLFTYHTNILVFLEEKLTVISGMFIFSLVLFNTENFFFFKFGEFGSYLLIDADFFPCF